MSTMSHQMIRFKPVLIVSVLNAANTLLTSHILPPLRLPNGVPHWQLGPVLVSFHQSFQYFDEFLFDLSLPDQKRGNGHFDAKSVDAC